MNAKEIDRAYPHDSVKQGAFENAIDCLVFGMGKKYWKDMKWDMELPKEESDAVWTRAFYYVAEGTL